MTLCDLAFVETYDDGGGATAKRLKDCLCARRMQRLEKAQSSTRFGRPPRNPSAPLSSHSRHYSHCLCRVENHLLGSIPFQTWALDVSQASNGLREPARFTSNGHRWQALGALLLSNLEVLWSHTNVTSSGADTRMNKSRSLQSRSEW